MCRKMTRFTFPEKCAGVGLSGFAASCCGPVEASAALAYDARKSEPTPVEQCVRNWRRVSRRRIMRRDSFRIDLIFIPVLSEFCRSDQ